MGGHISFKDLLDLIVKNGIPKIPYTNDKTKKIYNSFPEYKKLRNKLVKEAQIPQKAGWYVWVNILAEENNRYIYIGKTDRGKYNLRKRISEHIWEGRIALWAKSFPTKEKEMLDELNNNSEHSYDRKHQNYICCKSTSHIIWCTFDEISDRAENLTIIIKEVEAELIDIIQPRANRKKGQYSKKYTSIAQSVQIVFKKEIEDIVFKYTH